MTDRDFNPMEAAMKSSAELAAWVLRERDSEIKELKKEVVQLKEVVKGLLERVENFPLDPPLLGENQEHLYLCPECKGEFDHKSNCPRDALLKLAKEMVKDKQP